MAFNPFQFRKLIVDTLEPLGLAQPAAVELLLGTAAVESRFGTYLYQLRGPARGVFQIEPETEELIWRWLARAAKEQLERPADPRGWSAVELLNLLWEPARDHRRLERLVVDLHYSIVMARLLYYSIPQPLPDPDDTAALAAYWKAHYNTPQGGGRESDFVRAYGTYVSCVTSPPRGATPG